jgi:hypothetical protein
LHIFKIEEKIDPRNYRTIRIRPICTQLNGEIIERKISKRVDEKYKRATGQARFRPKNSITDHYLGLRHMFKKTWDTKDEELWCCFINSKRLLTQSKRKIMGEIGRIRSP